MMEELEWLGKIVLCICILGGGIIFTVANVNYTDEE
jgi:hypothetical protein